MTDRLDEIKTTWNVPAKQPRPLAAGRDDVVWLVGEVERLREALADIARGYYSDPLCQRTPEQRAREALASKP
jgi:hypothetical protein